MEWLKEKVSEYDLLMLQLELRMDTITTAARIAHEAGVPVMLNPAPAAALSDELLSCLTYVSPNEHEAALLSGLPLSADEQGVDQKDLDAVVQNLCSRGINKLLITLGSNGAVLCDETDRIQVPCVHMPLWVHSAPVWQAVFQRKRHFRWQLIRRRSPYPAWEPCRPCRCWTGYVS